MVFGSVSLLRFSPRFSCCLIKPPIFKCEGGALCQLDCHRQLDRSARATVRDIKHEKRAERTTRYENWDRRTGNRVEGSNKLAIRSQPEQLLQPFARNIAT